MRRCAFARITVVGRGGLVLDAYAARDRASYGSQH
jgi:hypothetical protein